MHCAPALYYVSIVQNIELNNRNIVFAILHNVQYINGLFCIILNLDNRFFSVLHFIVTFFPHGYGRYNKTIDSVLNNSRLCFLCSVTELPLHLRLKLT